MNTITLHMENRADNTAVSNYFIDTLMPQANGEFVKIYLYLLRCVSAGHISLSVSEMADLFNQTEADILRGLRYWDKMNALRLNFSPDGMLTGISLTDLSASSASREDDPRYADNSVMPNAIVNSPAVNTAVSASAPHTMTSAVAPLMETAAAKETAGPESYSMTRISEFKLGDENFAMLLFAVEEYMGEPLGSSALQRIAYFYDTLKLPADLIEYLVESCVDNGHKSIRYMDKIALSWSASSIRTAEDARRSSSAYKQTHYGVMKAFGISGRKLAEYELELVDKWTSQFGFTLDIISEACKRTLQATNQPSFQYADTILENWHKCNIHHLEDIAILDTAYKKSKASSSRNVTVNKTAANRFNNFSQRTYNFEQLEKQLLNN